MLLTSKIRSRQWVASHLHNGACVMIPEVYAVGTATEAESAYKGVEAGGGISYDSAYFENPPVLPYP